MMYSFPQSGETIQGCLNCRELSPLGGRLYPSEEVVEPVCLELAQRKWLTGKLRRHRGVDIRTLSTVGVGKRSAARGEKVIVDLEIRELERKHLDKGCRRCYAGCRPIAAKNEA